MQLTMRGFLWDPPRVSIYYNFAWVPHTFEGVWPLLTLPPYFAHWRVWLWFRVLVLPVCNESCVKVQTGHWVTPLDPLPAVEPTTRCDSHQLSWRRRRLDVAMPICARPSVLLRWLSAIKIAPRGYYYVTRGNVVGTVLAKLCLLDCGLVRSRTRQE